jgi:uroporphyrinogen decarboxylase
MEDLAVKSRERVLAALRFEEADRAPIDLGAHRSTGMHVGTYYRLRAHLGLPRRRVRLYDVMQQLGDIGEDMLDRFHADVAQIHRLRPAMGMSLARWKEMDLPDGTEALVPEEYSPQPAPQGGWYLDCPGGERAYMPSAATYFEAVAPPLPAEPTPRDIDRLPWDDIEDADIEFVVAQARRVRETTGRASLVIFGGNILEAGNGAFGFQNFMYQLAANPSIVAYYFERLTETYLTRLKKFLPAVEGLVDVIAVGDDLGGQGGPLVSPAMYRAMIKPHQARVYEHIRNHSSAYLFLHSCGSIAALLDDLLEIGVQILNPVQTSARDMAPDRLKKRYGKNIVFWGGGCDTQRVLSYGTPGEVRRDVAERVRVLKPGGGFVFTQIHNVLANVPPENVVAMLDTAYESGRY